MENVCGNTKCEGYDDFFDDNCGKQGKAVCDAERDIKPVTAHPLELSDGMAVIASQRRAECKGCMWHPAVCEYCCCSLFDGND